MKRASDREALASSQLNEFFGHEDAACSGRLTIDLAEHAIAVAFIECGGLKADRIEHAATTPAALRFLLRLTHNLAAESLTAQRFGKKENVDEQKAERRATEKARNHLVRLGIGHQHRKRPPVPVAGLLLVEPAEPGFNHSRCCRV